MQVKKLDVEVLGWRGYKWSAVGRLVGRGAEFSKTTLEVAYGREMNIEFSGNSASGHSCSQHANWPLTNLHILELPFLVPSTTCTCVMIMLFNQLIDMPHQWMDYLGKGEMLKTTFERNKLFVNMEHFWDLLFQLMRHGTKTFVIFIFLYSVVGLAYRKLMGSSSF